MKSSSAQICLPSALALFACVLPPLHAAEPPTATLDTKHRALFKEYCVSCHNADKQKGEVRLDDIAFTVGSIEQADLWQKVLNSLISGEMPPEDEKQPDTALKTEFLDDLQHLLVAARGQLSDSGGEITMRRLNRREYGNTIRELLGVEIDTSDLPDDRGAGTFDTVGSSLFLSSDQIEQYLVLGRRALDEAFAWRDAAREKSEVRHHIEPEKVATPIIEGLVKRLAEQGERFSRYAVEVEKAVAAPENREAVEKLQLTKENRLVRLFYNVHQLKGAPDPQKFGFRDYHTATFTEQQRRLKEPFCRHYLTLPERERGAYLCLVEGYMRLDVVPPKPLPAGNYVLRLRVGAVEGTPKDRHFIEIGHPDKGAFKSGLERILETRQVTGTVAEPEIMEVPVRIDSGMTTGFAVREKQLAQWVDMRPYFFQQKNRNGYGPDPAVWIDWAELEGPLSDAGEVATWKERREVEEHANAMVGGIYNGYLKGGHEAAQAFLASGQAQKGIPDEAEARFRIRQFEQHGPSYRRYLEDPLTQTGSLLTIGDIYKEEFIALPPENPSGWRKTQHPVETVPAGGYRLRFRIGAVAGAPQERCFVDLGSRTGKEDFTLLQTFQVTGTTESPQVIEVSVPLAIDGPRKFVLRERRDVRNDYERDKEAREETGVGPPPALWIDWVEWEGLLPKSGPASALEQTLATHPPKDDQPEAARARAILANFAHAAFREAEPEADYVDRLVTLFETRRAAGDGFEVALREPLSAILASPGFLYLSEPVGEGKSKGLTGRELAVRLSYFLWSAPPDRELLDLAKQGKLSDPATLSTQVDRMLDDGRSHAFVTGLVHQWLGMDRLDFFQFDSKQHAEFDESVKAAARREVFESFAHLLRENGSLGRLLKSDEVVVNSLLAAYYGLEGVSGDEFRPVKLPAGSPRGGLLGMAAILAMGSNGIETSPVERGAWVLRKLLHDPPPPAPPNVPQISRLEDQLLTTRERLAAHMEEAQCASCHRRIDPIGFGLENFDAIGLWRTTDHYEKKGVGTKKWEIDPAGAFHNGPAFADYFELLDLIAAREADFARGFTEALIEYALGRPFGFTDEDLAEEILSTAKAKNHAVNEFIQALVKSSEFSRK